MIGGKLALNALAGVALVAALSGLLYAVYDAGGDARQSRLEAVAAQIEVEKIRQLEQANDRQREESAALQTRYDELKKARTHEKAKSDSTVARLTERLRNERARRPVPVPGTTEPATTEPGQPGCDGSRLFAEDGSFLVGEAAVSAERRDALIEARTLYEQARQALERLQAEQANKVNR